ncbi:conserved hypothetical protein [Afipia carboxidovorans OM5]|uniref:DUF2336 domain-containing protein n=1 Tax=Afipia carboxidovorans (strain ATCC 49405 / DSM 1227 / KCTC 32145 / OM5) TaxID=504832 RepID=B6JG50_AFIC5|nr:DUF2336 domain-containing protein [Afipia carboxidovorans]ACI93763.1 conserved hypothetical protein [Afipia carboxidovorans OM5]AEI02556.1 hypothetical protein OCA4_c14160 [Afipia carboxidovorans OM4]AEI06132.1 hypothetical protein OCA5_c14160 [Afipia carboxidovorans OM5]BEV46924.1 DUF2336 domain-containing protein [Afipia carboxidovorans]
MSTNAANAKSLLADLQTALTHGTVARRVETLQRVTDLFLYAPSQYSEEQIALFDDVFHCLIRKMEMSAKALLAQRIATVPEAPTNLIHTLAFDDLVEVAAPVLSYSEKLSDDVLVRNARQKSQGHLLAISKRKILSQAVTDVLVERGNDDVVESTVNNPGANFSDNGYGRLISRAEGNDDIASCLGMRPIPRHYYLQLVAKASRSVREKLNRANPHLAADVASVVKEVTLQASNAKSEETIRAQTLVKLLHTDGRLNEAQVATFADNGRVEEISTSIALMTDVPILTVENMMIEPRAEGLLVLAKVAGLSWATVEKILKARHPAAPESISTSLSEYQDHFNLLRPSTAQQVLRFYRMREATGQVPFAASAAIA